MANEYIDSNGLETLWGQIRAADALNVQKDGDIMTGTLSWQSDDWFQLCQLLNGSEFRVGFSANTSNQLIAYEKKAGSTANECYYFPTPTATTENGYYNILTTKESGLVSSAEKSTATDIPNATYTDITSLSYTSGTYVVIGTVLFGTNSDGYRQILISTTSGGSAKTNRWAEWKGAPTNGSQTVAEVMTIVKLTGSGTLYLKAYQTSGGALSTSGGLIAVRIV